MNIITDSQIDALVAEAKPIPDGLRPLRKTIDKSGHRRKDFEITSSSGSNFMIYIRQSLLNPFDFSVILGY